MCDQPKPAPTPYVADVLQLSDNGLARAKIDDAEEEIFREMLQTLSAQLEHTLPPGLETQGDVEAVLRLVAKTLLELHKNPDYVGFLRMVIANSREHPWIAEEFAAVMDLQTDRLIRLLTHLTSLKVLNCRNPILAAHQFMGALNDVSLWPMMLGRDRIPIVDDEINEETVRMFMTHYGAPSTNLGLR